MNNLPKQNDNPISQTLVLLISTFASAGLAGGLFYMVENNKKNDIVTEQNRIQQTKKATEYDQIKSVNPKINFKSPQASEKEKNGGVVIQIIESENPLKLEDPIIQSTALIAARNAKTNRYLISFVFEGNTTYLIKKSHTDKIAEVAKLVESLNLGVSFNGHDSIDDVIDTEKKTSQQVKLFQPTKPFGEIEGAVLTDEQYTELEYVLRNILGDFKLVRIKEQAGQKVRAFIEVYKLK